MTFQATLEESRERQAFQLVGPNGSWVGKTLILPSLPDDQYIH